MRSRSASVMTIVSSHRAAACSTSALVVSLCGKLIGLSPTTSNIRAFEVAQNKQGRLTLCHPGKPKVVAYSAQSPFTYNKAADMDIKVVPALALRS